MASVLSGTAGIDFSVTDTDAALTTGTLAHKHEVLSAHALTPSSLSLVATITGSLDGTGLDFDLNSLVNQTSGANTAVVVKDQDINFTTISQIIIYCTHASQTLKLGAVAANNLLTWDTTGDGFVIPAGENNGLSFIFPNAVTIGANGKFNLLGSGAGTGYVIHVLGT